METRYAARRDWPVERLAESLSALLQVRRRPIVRHRITFLDTPDGRVGRAGASLTLTADAGGSRIQWRHGNVRVGCTLEGALQFAWDLPRGAVRQRIEPIVGMRRLLPLAEAEQDGVLLEVLDEARKTVARISIVVGRVRAPARRSPWQAYQPFLTLNALRGYDEQCAAPIAIIESRPGIERTDLALQGHVLGAIGTSVPQDVSRYRIGLEPMVPADVGLLRMQRELFRIVAANHAGVLADLDSEFLHDFRAGLRRSRTLFGQIDGVLPQTEIDHLDAEFAWLDGITGPVRDLDVLLLGLRSSSTALDEDRQGLLLTQLEHERAGAQRALIEQLRSARCARLMDRWQEVLSRDAGPRADGGCGALPLLTIVSHRAWRLYRLTLADIERVRSDTPADELHRIRVNARRLRHLVDAAASLFDPGELAIVQSALGRLQSVLGDINDACVQARWLRRYAAGCTDAEGGTTGVRQAAEALADLAQRRAAALRKPVNQQLLRFGEAGTRAVFERVFHSQHSIELVQ